MILKFKLSEIFTSEYISYLDDADNINSLLLSLYKSNKRHYHNLDHIFNVLFKIEEIQHFKQLSNDLKDCVKLAALFHDCIYNGEDGDAEASGSVAYSAISGTSLKTLSKKVKSLILETLNHRSSDMAGKILCDADLCILAADESEYNIYKENIKKEYLALGFSEEIFNKGRMMFLMKTLNKNIFQTNYGIQVWEDKAKENIKRELRERLI